MVRALVIYHCGAALLTGLSLYFQSQSKTSRTGWKFAFLGMLLALILGLGALIYPLPGFGRMQLLAWGVFLYVPIYLVGSITLFLKSTPIWRIAASIFLLALLAVGVDAFLVEPQRLEVTRIDLESEKISAPLTIGLLADIQTDRVGDYEKRVFERLSAEDPDLVLFAGDYLQVSDPDRYPQEAHQLNEIIRLADLDPELGLFAIQGNVDPAQWGEVFQDLDVVQVKETHSFDLGKIQLTALSWLDSGDTDLQIGEQEGYHIVLGHSPNYSLGDIEADLLLAGHTHGGQFRLPGVGPLLTLSAVPRSWASGLTEIDPGKYLLVSRGIGMERGPAPRLRFLCRPELILIHLLPAEDGI